MEDMYYYEAIEDVNIHCEEYTEQHIRPYVWNDLVREQINYLAVLNQLPMYLFYNDHSVLNKFSDACIHYDEGYFCREDDEEEYDIYGEYYIYDSFDSYDDYEDNYEEMNYDDVTDVTMLAWIY
jgi:hypothetical protein